MAALTAECKRSAPRWRLALLFVMIRPLSVGGSRDSIRRPYQQSILRRLGVKCWGMRS